MFVCMCLYICLSVYLSIYLSEYLFVRVSVYLSIFLSVYLSVCVSVYISVFISVFISVCVFVFLLMKMKGVGIKQYETFPLRILIEISPSLPPPLYLIIPTHYFLKTTPFNIFSSLYSVRTRQENQHIFKLNQ